MLSIAFSSSVVCGEPKGWKKFRRLLSHERREDLQRMADKIKDIGEDELRRSKELLREHREYYETKPKEKSIDFYEK
jgi:succinylglutamate desuccinylase